MGNRIGVDISGTLIRVSCICLPCNPKKCKSGIFESPESENGPEDATKEKASIHQRRLDLLDLKSCSDENGRSHSIHRDAACPYRKHLHDNTPEEIAIKNFLDLAPLWGPPRTICFDFGAQRPGKAFCFVIDLDNAEDALREVCQNGYRRIIWYTVLRNFNFLLYSIGTAIPRRFTYPIDWVWSTTSQRSAVSEVSRSLFPSPISSRNKLHLRGAGFPSLPGPRSLFQIR